MTAVPVLSYQKVLLMSLHQMSRGTLFSVSLSIQKLVSVLWFIISDLLGSMSWLKVQQRWR